MTELELKRPDLHGFLMGQQKMLLAALEVVRENIAHPGAKGDGSEFNWRKTIDDFLPNRYCVTKGFVIDSLDHTSEQFDVILYDTHYCPLFFESDGWRYIPAESVYAVFEVKQEFDKHNIEYAADKARTARRLHRTNLPIKHAGGTFSPRPLFEIIGGILALKSSWSPPLDKTFDEHLTQTFLSVDGASGQLDLGCALSHGSFEATVGESGVEIQSTESEGALMFFLLRLFQRLQGLGTVPAIDLQAYSRQLEDNND